MPLFLYFAFYFSSDLVARLSGRTPPQRKPERKRAKAPRAVAWEHALSR
ncbi:MAG: hypothetical protein JWN48_4609 [Myxococcaceae bacterium]|nr:hypothetical protein [Myxococcaceae bacterium]